MRGNKTSGVRFSVINLHENRSPSHQLVALVFGYFHLWFAEFHLHLIAVLHCNNFIPYVFVLANIVVVVLYLMDLKIDLNLFSSFFFIAFHDITFMIEPNLHTTPHSINIPFNHFLTMVVMDNNTFLFFIEFIKFR